jgi:hypothetical protein
MHFCTIGGRPRRAVRLGISSADGVGSHARRAHALVHRLLDGTRLLSVNERPRRSLDLVPVVLVFALAVVLLPSVVDVDLWGHIRFGGDIVRTRELTSADPYSFTADRPWINHEWLSEVLIYWSYAAGGAAGLTLLRLTIIAAILAIVAWTLRRAGVSEKRLIVLLGFVAVLTYTRTQHVRPQLFSLLMFAALMAVVGESHRRRAMCWIAVPILALWANFHGGWIVGLGALGIWAAGSSLARGTSWPRRAELMALVAAAAAATLINPYGIGLWSFLRSTVGLGRPDISEWHPITSAGAGVFAFWAVSAIVAVAVVARARRVNLVNGATVVIVGALAFRVSRLDAFFAIAVFILLAPQLAAVWSDAPEPRATRNTRRIAVAIAVLCACAVRWSSLVALDLGRAEWLPEADAVGSIKVRSLQGRMLTYFDWGEYAIWHLSPDVKVSIDGRRETVYGPAPLAGHLAVYRNDAAGATYIKQLDPDFVWLPKNLTVVADLRSSGAWTTIFEGPTSVVLARHPAPGRSVPIRVDSGVRFFPGP